MASFSPSKVHLSPSKILRKCQVKLGVGVKTLDSSAILLWGLFLTPKEVVIYFHWCVGSSVLCPHSVHCSVLAWIGSWLLLLAWSKCGGPPLKKSSLSYHCAADPLRPGCEFHSTVGSDGLLSALCSRYTLPFAWTWKSQPACSAAFSVTPELLNPLPAMLKTQEGHGDVLLSCPIKIPYYYLSLTSGNECLKRSSYQPFHSFWAFSVLAPCPSYALS